MGGLGNQIFQYAFGQVMKEHGIEVFYDISWFEKHPKRDTHREFSLDKLVSAIPLSLCSDQLSIHEREYNRDLLFLKDRNFIGYWQYTDYYDAVLPRLIETVKLRQGFYTEEYLMLRKRLETEETVSIHVRRGDYMTTPGFSVLKLAYYFEALVQTKGALVIFSDDIPWCKEVFLPTYFNRELIFVELNEYLSWDLMRMCSHNIIANSSFSTTAAMLNTNPTKKVIAPAVWGIDGTERTKEVRKHLPKDWILQ
jgi:hypothetical protein